MIYLSDLINFFLLEAWNRIYIHWVRLKSSAKVVSKGTFFAKGEETGIWVSAKKWP